MQLEQGKGENRMQFEYFGEKQKGQFEYYRIPKLLFSEKDFYGLSAEAKLLYGMMADRMGLSGRNGWKDEKGHIYVYYPIREIKRMFHCGNDKAVKVLKELDVKEGIGLIETIRQGQGKPSRIYVKKIVV